MGVAADDNRTVWGHAEPRAVIDPDRFRPSRSLKKTLRRGTFAVGVDGDFEAVLDGCAGGTERRPDSWINPPIRAMLLEMHRLGYAHAIAVRRDGRLVGGLYGIRVGAAFFGESMFSLEADASKVALTHLVAHLRAGGYRLLDCQMVTPHLTSLGAVETDLRTFHARLTDAVGRTAPALPCPGADTVLVEMIRPADPSAQ